MCVCLCVGFLTFSSRSSIVPICPCNLAFLPTTTALSLSPLLLSTLSCRVAVAATAAHPPPPPLALLVVRQDNLDTSFISSPCTIEFTFALRTPRLETHQDTPYIPPQGQPPKNIVISSQLASFQHSSTLRQQPKTFDCARPGYLEEAPSSRKPRLSESISTVLITVYSTLGTAFISPAHPWLPPVIFVLRLLVIIHPILLDHNRSPESPVTPGPP